MDCKILLASPLPLLGLSSWASPKPPNPDRLLRPTDTAGDASAPDPPPVTPRLCCRLRPPCLTRLGDKRNGGLALRPPETTTPSTTAPAAVFEVVSTPDIRATSAPGPWDAW
ncbi:Hypothetical predicted protein [Pelobates cultripes]|uniref:Uncharacterized protein n=1 Tax=Pelobates cultripes TaxID=61616 RepID=A0AAD1RA14_PELCU|nr:Hypothetical predicted protein [Pelobates cultripes]